MIEYPLKIKYNLYQITPVAGSLVAGVFLFISCSTFNSSPYWLNPETRSEREFFHGFSKVNKTTSSVEYINKARIQSMVSISQAIKSDIDVKSINKIKEVEYQGLVNNFQLEKSYEMISTVRSNLSIEGIEHIGEWEDKKYYYVYNRLSKSVYNKLLNRKISKAIELAENNYKEGIKLLNFNPASSLRYFITGLKALIPYQDQLLIIKNFENPEKVIHIDLELRKIINRCILSIQLIPIKKIQTTNIVTRQQKQIELISTIYSSDGEKLYVKDLPVLFNFTLGDGILTEKMISDKNGYIYCPIQKLNGRNQNYQIKAKLDLELFTGNDEIGNYLFKELSGTYIPHTFFNIDVEPLVIFLKSNEKSLGHVMSNPLVTPALIKILEEKIGAIFTSEQYDYDFILELNIDTQKRGEVFSLYTAFAQMSIYFYEDNNIIFANNFYDVKGTHTNYKKASQEAIKKLAEKVKEEIGDEIANQIIE
ncbi:MAG: hypothetical protein CMG69_00735 [Candidatus Marinimicrobia bacterium]|nr:hypothetical protein [Candidatus Neomarinimicrobiota bacterium]